MPNQTKKQYQSELGHTKAFFIPHPSANHLNAQDVAYELVASTKDLSTVIFNCFDGGTKLVIKDEIVANLICEIQTRLEMIEAILPMAFNDGEA